MNKYENLGVVGEGSYGVVMKCKHKSSGQIVAIKKFLETDEDQLIRKIAMREINMLRKLRHGNLVNLIEVFRRKKHLCLVLEYVDHTVLDELEQHPGGLGNETSREYIFQILRGLDFCHSNQIIHRDVKPENVLVSNMGVVKLCDFGFARTLSVSGESCTDYVATRWYRAPELLIGDTRYGKEVDVWASGCLFAEMITGDPLFPGESDIDQLFCIMMRMGHLSPKHQNMMAQNPMFRGMRTMPEVMTSLREKFHFWPKLSLDFLQETLQMDPEIRSPTWKLLEHLYFTWDNFPSMFLPQLESRLQEEFSGTLEFSNPIPKGKSSASIHNLSGKKSDDRDIPKLVQNEKSVTKSITYNSNALPPCTLTLTKGMQTPPRPPTKISPMTSSKPKKNIVFANQEENSSPELHLTFPTLPIGNSALDTHSWSDTFQPRRLVLSPYSTTNQSSARKPSPIAIRRNNELTPVGSHQSVPLGFEGLHGERSFLHHRNVSLSSKKKFPGGADPTSASGVSHTEADTILPNILRSPGPFSPPKAKISGPKKISFKSMMPNISPLESYQDAATFENTSPPLSGKRSQWRW